MRVKNDEEFYNHIKALNPDLIIVVAFGQILPESILEIPRLGCINIHGSLLPKYRGAGPIQWSVINGEKVTGVTIMYMDKGMDTGDMLYTKEMPLDPKETYQTLHDKMMSVGAQALKEAMPLIISGGEGRKKQNDEEATYAPMLNKAIAEIDWAKSAGEIDCLIRGLNPWPVAYTYYEEMLVKIWDADLVEGTSEYQAGTIVNVGKEGMLIQTGNGQILIKEIQVPNKKRMAVSEYIKGNTILEGQILGR